MEKDFIITTDYRDTAQPYRVMKGNVIYKFARTRSEAEKMLEILKKEN